MSRYSKIILVIAFIDLISTVIGIHFGYFTEANPLLYWCLKKGGLNLLITMQIFLVFSGLGILEFVWQKNLIAKKLMGRYQLTATAGYCFLYLIGFASENLFLLTTKAF